MGSWDLGSWTFKKQVWKSDRWCASKSELFQTHSNCQTNYFFVLIMYINFRLCLSILIRRLTNILRYFSHMWDISFHKWDISISPICLICLIFSYISCLSVWYVRSGFGGLLNCWIVELLYYLNWWKVCLFQNYQLPQDCYIFGIFKLLDTWIIGFIGFVGFFFLDFSNCFIVGFLDCWIARL